MSGLVIPEEIVEVAAKALMAELDHVMLRRGEWPELARAVLNAAFTKLGMMVEEDVRIRYGERTKPTGRYRLTSNWFLLDTPEPS